MPFLSVSHIKSACTEDKVAQAEKPFKTPNGRNIALNSWSGQLHSAVATDIVSFEYLHQGTDVAFQFVNN